jgi:ubiquinone/menaquinone biosynthesis C-methylase UbiE
MCALTNSPNHANSSDEAQQAQRRAAIEDALRAHPGVREAAAVFDERDHLAAFVVPDDGFVDDVLGRGTAGATLVNKWRKIFDLSQLSREATSTSVGFNTMGWDSSYTRGPIAADEMQEWVENTVGDILRLNPKSLCEIGCGTGMLVMRIAPHCDRYVAVDQSPAVLERLRQQLRTVPEAAERVEVVESQAANIDGFDKNSFDTVVLSSVVQFFPNAAYLTKVLEKAINIVRPGGHVYVGDVRSLPLFQAFASSVELFQAADSLAVTELRERIRRRIDREPELVISPEYFLSLPRKFPKISRVDIRPLRGRADNEMTRFRYEAILHIGPGSARAFEGKFLDWADRKSTLDEIRSVLSQHAGRSIGIKNIRNARLEKDFEAMTILDAAEGAYTAGQLRRELEQLVVGGIHPQDLFDLEDEDLGFAVFLSWAACRKDGTFDAFFVPKQDTRGIALPAINWPAPDASTFLHHANAPGQGKMRNELADQLMKFCKQNLPQDSVPREIILVDSLEHFS